LTRRIFDHIKKWEVANHATLASATSNASVDEKSGLGPLEIFEPDPIVVIPIPGGVSVMQVVAPLHIEGSIYVSNFEGVVVMLYETDIGTGAGDQFACVDSSGYPDRNTMAYCGFTAYHSKVDESADPETESSETTLITLTNTLIRSVTRVFDRGPRPWRIDFIAEKLLQTDA